MAFLPPLIALFCLLPIASLANSLPSDAAPNLSTVAKPAPATAPLWVLVESSEHDERIFTQGLELQGNRLFESSGLYRQSFLQHSPYPAPDNAIGPRGEMHPRYLQRVPVQHNRFAEGLTVLNNELFLLTWRSGDVFLFNPDTLAPQGKLTLRHRGNGQGWGLSNDGSSLIISDGSDILRWLNPQNLRVRKQVYVRNSNNKPVTNLNELEFINGEIFANIWQSDTVLRIDARSGKVLQELDLTGLWPAKQRPKNADVLNGIAWDARSQSLLITGKRWPTLYRLKLRDAPGSLVAAPAK